MTRKLLAFCIGLLLTCVVHAQTAVINASATSGCSPLTVNFTDGSTGATSWNWNFGNGNTSTLQNPPGSQIYITPGPYTVTLSINGGPITSKTVTVNASPVVNANASDLSGTSCFPLAENFTDLSTVSSGTITGWNWDFGDGNTSTQKNPSHTYTAANPVGFPVSLQVTSSNGCSSTLKNPLKIIITSGVIANFTTASTSGCKVPITINFTNTSTGPGTLTYAWSFGDGNTAGNVTTTSDTYTTAGTYPAILTVSSSSGCTAKDTQNIVAAGGSVQSMFTGPDSACVGTPVSFQNTSTPPPSVANWDFGDGTIASGQNVTHAYTTANTYTVKLVNVFGGCNDSISKPIIVLAPPVANFKAIDTVTCSNSLTVNFTDISTNATNWSWNFGDGGTSTVQSPSHTYTGYGSYTVTLTVSNSTGCSGILAKTSYVKLVQPTVQISNLPLFGCAPFTLKPVIKDSLAGGVTSYLWDFGDGTTSTSDTPLTHIYTAGTYVLKLTLTGQGGCTATTSDTVKVGTIKPTAAFTAAPTAQCVDAIINFTDQSTGGVTQWLWDFGDGVTSTDANPTTSYNTPGVYPVKEVVYNNGCGDTLTKTNYITINLPKADFLYGSNCSGAGLQFTFTDNSQGANTWLWNFGDGTTSNVQGPVTHTYTTGLPGYTVSLTVTNTTTGCTDTKSITVTTTIEQANFLVSPAVACVNTQIDLSTVNVVDSNVASYTWDYGIPTTPPSVGPHFQTTHLGYSAPGTYTLTLTLLNKNGCVTSSSQQVQVNGPTVQFSANAPGGCTSLAAIFTDLSTDASNPIVKWVWDYGDGSPVQTYTAPPFTHNYTGQGIYSVKLTVTDAGGCVGTITKPNLIAISFPRAIFSTADSMTCPGSPITFINNSSGYGLTYAWDFGDATNSTATNPPAHNYIVGHYPVSLTVTDQYGCTDMVTHTIIVDTPHASFDLTATLANCPPLIDTFTFTGSYNQTVKWNFGDGGTSSLLNPVHFYIIPGTYFDTLIVTSHGGCTDTATSPPIQVFGPYGALTYSPLQGCHQLNVNFNVVTSNVVKYVWDFKDGQTQNTLTPATSHTYDSIGKYVPLVILTDATGCAVPVLGIDTVVVTGSHPQFGYSANVFCNNGSVTFSDLTQSIFPVTNYLWDFGDGSTSTDENPTHFFATPGSYTIKFYTTTPTGCLDSIVKTDLIKIVANPVIDIGNVNYTLCQPASQTFQGVVIVPDTSALTWKWNFYNGNTATGQDPPTQSYPNAGSDSVQLIVVNSSGCTDTIKKYFPVYPLPLTNAGIDTAVCVGGNVTLQGTGADSYIWVSPDNTLSCHNCQNPVATPDTTTTYVLTGYTTFGCTRSDSVVVKVIQPQTITIISATDSICIGQSVQLKASGETSYLWTPVTGLNDPTISNPIARPDTTTTYQVIGTDYKSCFADTESVKINVFNYPTINAGPDVTIGPGSSYQINATGSTDINAIAWSPSTGLSCTTCLTPVATPVLTTTYIVNVTNNGGCSASDSITIIVLCGSNNLFVPNTFSPNGDGMNDVFYVRGTGLSRIQSMLIFNRWGQVVFEKKDFAANDPAAGWDGTINGKPAPVDVYVYTIEVICNNSQIVPYHGNVALIR